MPMAASVPSTVAITVAITAMDTVTHRAFIMEAFWNSSPYQRKEKPSHLARLLPALKDWQISTTIGTYRNTRMMPR